MEVVRRDGRSRRVFEFRWFVIIQHRRWKTSGREREGGEIKNKIKSALCSAAIPYSFPLLPGPSPSPSTPLFHSPGAKTDHRDIQ